jgi:hypothetical protein
MDVVHIRDFEHLDCESTLEKPDAAGPLLMESERIKP